MSEQNMEPNAPEHQEPQIDEAILQEARESGWVPQDEWSGPEDHWVDAETFVRRGREINPILRKNNERLRKELDATRSKLGELELTVKEFGEMYKKMSENAYKRAITDLRAQAREARREGDDSTADSLEDQIESLKEESANIKVPSEKLNQPDPTQGREILTEWLGDNKWYNPQTNAHLVYMADGIALQLVNAHPELRGTRQLLDRVAEEVRKVAPDAFTNPGRKRGSPVSGSTTTTAPAKAPGKRTYADLPADAKAACDRFVKTIPGYTREQYVSDYFDGEQQ